MSRDLLRTLLSAAATAAILSGRFAACAVAAAPNSTSGAALVERTAEAWNRLCEEAVGDDAGRAQEAVTTLRASGIRGWREFRSLHLAVIERLAERPACLCDPDSHERRVAAALDKISAQRDAASSGLYWYTDWEAALAAAQRDPMPILSLRMLGRLDDDLSCANSRFFRTTLYADPELARHLRENFVLHWESVRPVPIITIDFGDGRKMERTITGNSAHYVLDTNGRIVDCLPGLYSPAEFRRQLDQARIAAKASHVERDLSRRRAELIRYHQSGIRQIDQVVLQLRKDAATPIAQAPVSASPDVNVPIVNGELGDSSVLPTALGETLVGPRPAPEPSSVWTAPTWTIDSSEKPTPKLKLVAATNGKTGMGRPSNRPPRPANSLQLPVPSQPTARQAGMTVMSKSRVEERLVEAVSPSLQVRFESGELVVDVLERPDPAAVPTPGVSPGKVDTLAIVMQALAAAIPAFRVDDLSQGPENSSTAGNPAMGITVTKHRVEKPLTGTLRIEGERSDSAAEPAATEDDLRRLARRIHGGVRLSAGSLKLIRAKFDSTPAEPVDGSPTWRSARFDRMHEALRRSIAGDTARNEYDLHRKIHAWLAENPDVDVAELNERVYAELFLTPRSDPWLGLAPEEAFPALDHGGLFVTP